MRGTVTVALLALLGAGSLALPASAQETARRKKTVAVLPARSFAAPCTAVFEPAREEDAEVRRAVAQAETTLSLLDDVELMRFVDLRAKMTGQSAYKEKLVLGRERYLLGNEMYRDLRQKEAEEHLRRAVELLEGIYYDVAEPEALSQVLMLLGVTMVEQGAAAPAHLAFKRALFVLPSTKLQRGYYPKPVEDAVLLACEDLRESADKEVPLGSPDRAAQFMAANGLDVLFTPIVVLEEERRYVLLLAFERKSQSVTFRERLEVGTADQTADAVDRALSRWAACAPFERAATDASQPGRLTFSAAYQEMVFVTYPTRSFFHSMGFSFETGVFFTQPFALVAKAQLTSSMPDRFGDMLDGFTSVRGMAGPAFYLSGSWWRLLVSPSAEFHYLGSFTVTTDPDCKFFASDSPDFAKRCPAGHIKEYPTDFLAGINVAVEGQLFMTNNFFLDIAGSVSTYFAPFDRSFDLNFPVAVEAGAGVAF